MAKVHTYHEPIHQGEMRLARILSAIPDEKLNLWFSVNYIPQVNDLDVIIWHEETGPFVVEVKAYALRDIHEFGFSSWVVGDFSKSKSPQNQALEAMYALRNYVQPKMGLKSSLPYLVPTVCFPKIKRGDWVSRWKSEEQIAKLGESFIFEDDISAGGCVLKERLLKIWATPPIGKPQRRPFSPPTPEVLADFLTALDVNARPTPTATDFERLKALEKEVSKDTRKQFKPFGNAKAIYYGHPGTGKTFRLIQIGLYHAKNGASVLFACYNKVLAADLRRLLYLLSSEAEIFQEALNLTGKVSEDKVAFRLQAVDVFQLALQIQAEHSDLLDMPPASESSDLDSWGGKLVKDIRENRDLIELRKYDTVLIDEAQDLKPWQFELLCLHCDDPSTLIAAVGIGQELYDGFGEAGEWIGSLKRLGAREISLRRNFRNPRLVFQLAYLFSQIAPDSGRIATALKKFEGGVGGEVLVEFARRSKALPRIMGINEAVLGNPEKWCIDDDLISEQYLDIISEEIEKLQENEEPIDLLVLVPDAVSKIHQDVVKALQKLREKNQTGFLDYTQEINRRLIAPNEKIRFCTFHSARGLEASRVIVFGIERIRNLCQSRVLGKNDKCDFKKLGFIVLSRSTFDSLIVRRSFDMEIAPFLEKCLAELKRISPTG